MTRSKRQALFTVSEIAELTGYSVRQLRRYIADGRLPVIRRKSRMLITADAARLLGRTLAPRSGSSRFVPIRLFAAITGNTERQVRHLIAKGAVSVVKLGRRVLIDGDEVELVAAEGVDRDRPEAWGYPTAPRKRVT